MPESNWRTLHWLQVTKPNVSPVKSIQTSMVVYLAKLRSTNYCTGIVSTCWFSCGPVSIMVKSIMMSAKTCLDARSLSSIQNQWFRYCTETNASGELDFPLCI